MIWSSVGLVAGLMVAAAAIVAWLSAVVGIAFVRVHTETEIEAPSEVVWAIIADFQRYPEWNPLMVEARARPAAGERMEWTAVVNGSARAYDATIDRANPGQELAWTGPVSSLPRALFWGHHRLVIEKRPDDRVRFVNTEVFGGVASIALQSFLRNDVSRAYDAHNAALKARAEALEP